MVDFDGVRVRVRARVDLPFSVYTYPTTPLVFFAGLASGLRTTYPKARDSNLSVYLSAQSVAASGNTADHKKSLARVICYDVKTRFRSLIL